MDFESRLGSPGNLSIASGSTDPWGPGGGTTELQLGCWNFFFVSALLLTFIFLFLSSSSVSLSYFNLLLPILLHEFHIYYSHTKRNLFSPLCDSCE